jgi:hypothetical protein
VLVVANLQLQLLTLNVVHLALVNQPWVIELTTVVAVLRVTKLNQLTDTVWVPGHTSIAPLTHALILADVLTRYTGAYD